MKRFISIVILSFFACIVTPLAHATRIAPLPTFQNTTILNAGTDNAATKTHAAILKGAALQKWSIVSDGGNTVRLSLTVRDKHEMVVDVHIRGNVVDVDYVSSKNMAYEKEYVDTRRMDDTQCRYVSGACLIPAGIKVIHPNYGVWVKRLLDASRKAAD
ncbi:MAG: hypothetical protein LBT71_06345 [Azoarcus sp.]|jgi:hypothetical protein|nr:hypothetical protein [Azoarcus sp.]